MDNALWALVNILHFVILLTLYRRRWRLLSFPAVILADLMETVFFIGILSVYGKGSWEYFTAVFTIGIINIALYMIAIWECRKQDIWYVWIPMVAFLVMKLVVYLSKHFVTDDTFQQGHEVLNLFNLACFILWTVAFLYFKPRKDQQYE